MTTDYSDLTELAGTAFVPRVHSDRVLTKKEFVSDQEAVSYTHLDVYKRQMYALISTLLARLPDADVVLLQASRTPQDAIFAAEFAALASRHEGLKVCLLYTSRCV